MYNAIKAIHIFVFIHLHKVVSLRGWLKPDEAISDSSGDCFVLWFRLLAFQPPGLAITFSYANNAFFLNAP